MRKIEKLSPELEAGLPDFREDRRARGLRLQWASEEEIRDSVLGLYRGAGIDAPKAVIVLDSPLACLIAWNILGEPMKAGDQLWDQLRDQLWGQLWGQLRGQLGDQLWGQLGDQLRGQLWDQLWGQLRGQLGDQLWGQLGGQLGDQLGDQLRGQLWDQLRDQLWGQLGGQLRGQLWGQLGGQLGDQLGDQLWGQLGDQLRGHLKNQPLWFAGGSEHYWISFYRYGLSAGVAPSPNIREWLSAWEVYADTAGALYPYEQLAFVSRRPTVLKFNDDRVLHSDSGPAMGFADGFGVHAWRGVRVPQEWIDAPNEVDPNIILQTEDVERRAAGAEIIGWNRMAAKMDRKVLDGDPETDLGALIEMRLKGLSEPGRFLQAQCPRNGMIVEGVPRVSDIDGLPIETAIAAQAWRDGLPASEYQHPTLRT